MDEMKHPSPKIKELLRTSILPALWERAPYASVPVVRGALSNAGAQSQPATVNRYLHSLLQAGEVFDAGRGWYSRLATPFALNRKPVSGLVNELITAFPLLDFSCWSTGQVASYGHHLLAKFVVFVNTERDSMESVVEALRKTGWTAYLHPTRLEAAKSFRQEDKTAVVRPSISRAPVDGKFATIEKILVDLYAETAALRLMDAGEYRQIVINLAGHERISVAALAQYAQRRGFTLEAVLPGIIN